jgi:hypothetical protein
MRNLSPKKKDTEEEARELERAQILSTRENRERVGFKIPRKLKAQLYEESNRDGRSVTDIVIEQLSRRYE